MTIGKSLSIIVLLLVAVFFPQNKLLASSVNIPALADAIYFAEGGANTRHPYGILKKYKTTTPRQACINTIKSNLKRWDGSGDFISFLGATYCPTVGKLSADEKRLNKYWVKNVSKLYKERTGGTYGNNNREKV